MTGQPNEYAALGAEQCDAAGSDPWDPTSLDFERRDSWLISYIDILTLFLTMLAMLLALTPNEGTSTTEPTVEASQSDHFSETETVEPAATETGFLYPLPDLWPDLFGLLEKREVHLDVSSLALFPEMDQSDLKDAVSTKPTTPFTGSESAQSIKMSSKHAAAPEDRLMKALAETGLSERLQAKKVSQSVHLQVQENILFAPGSADLTSEGRTLLVELSEVFSVHECIISIAGHTDNRPISNAHYPSNWELSAGRATAVARYLINRGYDPARLRAIGYADTQPMAANDTPEGRALNRRVSLIVQFPRSEGPTETQLIHH